MYIYKYFINLKCIYYKSIIKLILKNNNYIQFGIIKLHVYFIMKNVSYINLYIEWPNIMSYFVLWNCCITITINTENSKKKKNNCQ